MATGYNIGQHWSRWHVCLPGKPCAWITAFGTWWPKAKFWVCSTSWVSLDNLPNPSESQFLQYSRNNNMLQITVRIQLEKYVKKSWYLINFSLLFWFSRQAICKVYLVCLFKFLLFLKLSASHVQSKQSPVGNLEDVQGMDATRFSMERTRVGCRELAGTAGKEELE